MTVRSPVRSAVRSPVYNPTVGPWSAVALPESAFAFAFEGGADGFAIEPELLSLFQDSSGNTAITADGDQVGRAADLSGNDRHFTQTTDSNRPIFKTSSPRLQGNGSNRHLRLTPFAYSAGSAFFCFGISGASQAWKRFFTEGSTSSDTPYYEIRTYNSALRVRIRNDAGTTLLDYSSATTVFDSNAHVISIADTGSNLRVWIDGTEDAGSNVSYTRSGVLTTDQAALFAAARNGGYSEMFAGDIYGAVCVAGGVSDSVRGQIETVMAERSGVTLS